MHQLFDSMVAFLVHFIEQVGYFGIFIGMFLESTMFPLPSELIMIPAGMAVASGTMNLYLVIAFGVTGNVFGAIFSYFLAKFVGRTILFRIGKYFFIKPATIIKIEKYFKEHGSISVFIGRFLPGFRHFISLPAGVAQMNIKLFCFYTFFGSLTWTTILTILGYEIGENQELIKQYLDIIIPSCIIFCALVVGLYILLYKRNNKG